MVCVCLFIVERIKPLRETGERVREREIRSKGEETSRLKTRKKIKRDKLKRHLFLFDGRKLSKGMSVFCLATPVEG